MRDVVIGGSGQIDSWLLHWLGERGHEALGTYHSVAYPGLVYLDAAEAEMAAAWVRAQRPDVVFYPAGFTWVDGCERDPTRAWAVNLDQPLNLARAAADVGARFLCFSTDYVFDGLEGPYTEEGPPNPMSVYGNVKLDAEHALAEALGPAQLTMRTCWVKGPERQGKNFADQVVKALAEGRELVCSSDMSGSPSYGLDVALAAVRLAELGVSGLIHVAGPEVVGRVAFARAIAEALGLDPARIIPKPQSAIPKAYPLTAIVPRQVPLEGIDNQRLADCALLPYRKIAGSSAIFNAFSLSRGVVASDLPFLPRDARQRPQGRGTVPPQRCDRPGPSHRSVFPGPRRTPPNRGAAHRRPLRLGQRDPARHRLVVRTFPEKAVAPSPVPGPRGTLPAQWHRFGCEE
ncbi:MAG: SDR family oxidoreductase [Isosphaeraceae bacterium]